MTDALPRLAAALADRYRIEREIGEGGMATVYLAQDLKHDRNVALKVLRPELAAVLGAERFVQEIKTTAALQHPHILPLFDSGQADGFLFYVMPFIDGETLRARLDRETQLGIDDAVKLTTAVADALDYAHRHGVIHRDIKPENILLHDGRPMVADFGIALALSAAAGGRMTESGMSLGTPHYMSPEQATAEKEISARSDVYSLGSVLYEMLTGEPPHMGNSAQAIIMKIVTEDAQPVTRLRKSVPHNVTAAVAKALERLPADRFENAKAFAEALSNPGFSVSTDSGSSIGHVGTRADRWKPIAVGALVVAAVSVTTALWGWRTGAPAPVTRHEIVLGPSYQAQGSFRATVALAPDGGGIVYVDSVAGVAQLAFKPRGVLEGTRLPGTDGAGGPFFSPDGSWIGFFANRRLAKLSRAGGGVIQLAPAAGSDAISGAGAWGDDGTIYFQDEDFNLRRVSESGGTTEVLWRGTSVSAQAGVADIWPLPGARGAVFTVCEVLCNTSAVYVWDARRDTARLLFEDAWGVWYLPSGHIMYGGREGGAFAAPFNLRTLTAGAAIPVLEGVRGPDLVLAHDGTLAYVMGDATAALGRAEAVWVDRGGIVSPIDSTFQFDLPAAAGVALSPDGSALAVGVRSAGSDNIWIKDLSRPRGPVSRLTFGELGDIIPRWLPDGRAVLYSTTGGAASLLVKDAQGLGDTEEVISLPQAITEGVWSPDGIWLLLRVGRGAPNVRDILAYRPDRDSVPLPLLAQPGYDEISPTISPDGRWIAYASNESGRYEIYVRPFPDVQSGRWQVSSGGGVDPFWGRRAQQIFYLSATGMVAAEYGTNATFRVGEQRELFAVGPEFMRGSNYRLYDVAPDDRRFVMLRRLDGEPGSQSSVRVVLVENWFQELKEKMGR